MDRTALLERLAKDLAPINTLTAQEAGRLSQSCLMFLLEPSTPEEFNVTLATFAESTSNISIAALKSSVKALLVLLQIAIKDGMNDAKIGQLCTDLSLEIRASQAIAMMWATNFSKVASNIITKVASSNEIVDLDWSFGVTAASNDSDHVGKTYLQLKIGLASSNGSEGRRDIFLELSLEQFYQFLGQMEKCRSYIDILTGNLESV